MTNEQYLLKMRQDMRLKNYTSNTCDDYFRYVSRFLDFTKKDAMSITYADIREFIFHMNDVEHKKPSTINVYTAAIRFFFEYTLGYIWDPKKIPKMKRDKNLPVILTREQVNQLIDSMDNYKHKAITATMYSSGLRVSEVCHLRYEDISRTQKMIHVPISKNRQDRYTILSDYNLEILTEYWFRFNRPRGWLFPSTVRDAPLTTSAVEMFIKKHSESLGLPTGVTPHTMRHCFACHMLEDGVSHTFIQQLLGHRSPKSTDVYLQMTSKALMGIRSPFDTYREGLSDDDK
jgi:site-specific recombinase XerD